MDASIPIHFDLYEIYRQYSEILSGKFARAVGGYMSDDESPKARYSRDALSQLLNLVDSRLHHRMSIFDEIYKLMLRLNVMVDFSEFSRFYDFVFFVCRENGQKNITVSKAVTAWRLVLAGRFRLLNEWCDFVEKNQRHNISEDTWHQVLAFSRCVHENLEGYDPEGAWPVLIDDFVEHMYRVRGSNESPLLYNREDSEAPSFDDLLPGLKAFSGLKRKSSGNVQADQDSSDGHTSTRIAASIKRRQSPLVGSMVKCGKRLPGDASDDCSEIMSPPTLFCYLTIN